MWFAFDLRKSYLGASSDGHILCTNVDTLCRGCLEIKCPYSIDKQVTVELSPDDIANKFGSKFFMHYIYHVITCIMQRYKEKWL